MFVYNLTAGGLCLENVKIICRHSCWMLIPCRVHLTLQPLNEGRFYPPTKLYG